MPFSMLLSFKFKGSSSCGIGGDLRSDKAAVVGQFYAGVDGGQMAGGFHGKRKLTQPLRRIADGKRIDIAVFFSVKHYYHRLICRNTLKFAGISENDAAKTA